MAEIPTGSTPGPQNPTFSLLPQFIPAVIKRRLTRSSSRYALVRTEIGSSLPSRSMPSPFSSSTSTTTRLSTGDSTPRPSSSGSASTGRTSDDSFAQDEDVATPREPDLLALPVGVGTNMEGESGVRWNRVNPAFHLLRDAGYEAQQPQSEPRLVRSLYLNSVTYLLSALPEDLSIDEAALLRKSLPETLKPDLTLLPSPGHHPTASPSTSIRTQCHPGPCPNATHRSYLHRLLASIIVYFCLLLQLIMPYIKDVMFQLYRYDRAHRVTERVTAFMLVLAEKVGRGGVGLGNTVLNLYDGKPGTAVSGAAAWWAEGLAGGIYEGLGEGLVILGFGGLRVDLDGGKDKCS
ncbi:uncharacterized protein BDV17DRAFT_286156 [Aspergillus undulatus]|uniref:uncharacterized protein n=1 Tax=Aspergillus undulatus TaxID=1810928 RepID=UPI003CCE0B47